METFGRPTGTEQSQLDTEELLEEFLEDAVAPELRRGLHSKFLLGNMSVMGEGIQGLHCSRPWLCYWLLQATDLLGKTGEMYRNVPAKSIAELLFLCFTKIGDAGGFGGGPGQIPHLATTYAAVNAFSILSDETWLRQIDRDAVAKWLVSLRGLDGSFRMHDGGEVDVRASYCVAVISKLLDIEANVWLMPECSNYVALCQTFEGGFTNICGGSEAHGGYTQCALGALLLTKSLDCIDIPSLRRWLAERQFGHEGGFNGRTNKLVDSCYSHWIGSSHAMLTIWESYRKLKDNSATCEDLLLMDYGQLVDARVMTIDEALVAAGEEKRLEADAEHRKAFEEDMGGTHCETTNAASNEDDYEDLASLAVEDHHDGGNFLFNQCMLQNYVLRCCQNSNGGLMDKPEHPNDFYHTCYSLSGFSVSTNNLFQPNSPLPIHRLMKEKGWHSRRANQLDATLIGENKALTVRTVNPAFNICKDRVVHTLEVFRGSASI